MMRLRAPCGPRVARPAPAGPSRTHMRCAPRPPRFCAPALRRFATKGGALHGMDQKEVKDAFKPVNKHSKRAALEKKVLELMKTIERGDIDAYEGHLQLRELFIGLIDIGAMDPKDTDFLRLQASIAELSHRNAAAAKESAIAAQIDGKAPLTNDVDDLLEFAAMKTQRAMQKQESKEDMENAAQSMLTSVQKGTLGYLADRADQAPKRPVKAGKEEKQDDTLEVESTQDLSTAAMPGGDLTEITHGDMKMSSLQQAHDQLQNLIPPTQQEEMEKERQEWLDEREETARRHGLLEAKAKEAEEIKSRMWALSSEQAFKQRVEAQERRQAVLLEELRVQLDAEKEYMRKGAQSDKEEGKQLQASFSSLVKRIRELEIEEEADMEHSAAQGGRRILLQGIRRDLSALMVSAAKAREAVVVFIDKTLANAKIPVGSDILADLAAFKAVEDALKESHSDPNWLSKRLAEAKDASLVQLPLSRRANEIEQFFSVLPTADELASEDDTYLAKRKRLSDLLYMGLYPPKVRDWIIDAKTPKGGFTAFGRWGSIPEWKVTHDVNIPKFFPTLQRVDEEAILPADLRDGYRFGVTKQDLDELNVSQRVRDFLSFRWAGKWEINQYRRREATKKFGRTAYDTGSSEVQIAVLSDRINAMEEHMAAHTRDVDSLKIMRAMQERRKKLMKYLRSHDKHAGAYQRLLKEYSIEDVPRISKAKY